MGQEIRKSIGNHEKEQWQIWKSFSTTGNQLDFSMSSSVPIAAKCFYKHVRHAIKNFHGSKRYHT